MARPRTTPLPSIASLRAQFAYNPFTGELVHKPRKGEGHYVARFNRQYAGRVAGTVMNQGYLFVAPHNSNQMLGHRVAWAIHYGEWPEIEIDHRDGNKLNNAIDNLRPATRTQNMRNLPIWGTVPYKGVGYRPACPNRPYSARINIGGKRLHLGGYATAELAAEAYARAARKHHSDFAFRPVGFIDAAITFKVAA